MFRPLALSALMLAGCASVTAVPITAENPVPNGIRIYGAKPILIIQGGQASVQYIPNLSEAYALRFNAFLAANDTNVTINPNGTLGGIHVNLDSTDAIPLVQPLVDRLASEGDAQSNLTGSDVRVFDFVFAENGTVTLREISHGTIRTTSTRMPMVGASPDPQPPEGSLSPTQQ